MKKHLIAWAICAALAVPFSVHADWTTSDANQFYAQDGIMGARVSLSSQQLLRMSLSPADEMTELYFLYGDASDEDAFSLQLPCHVEESDNGPSALVTILPVVNTGNGNRFYVIDTGVPDGCLIVSYKKGSYKTAFDAASVEGDWREASIEVQKKNLVLHLTDEAGNTTDFLLSYDKKADTFSAEGAASVITIIAEE